MNSSGDSGIPNESRGAIGGRVQVAEIMKMLPRYEAVGQETDTACTDAEGVLTGNLREMTGMGKADDDILFTTPDQEITATTGYHARPSHYSNNGLPHHTKPLQ